VTHLERNTLLGLTIYLLIANERVMKPLGMVARDGIEPPTQAFSGLCSRDCCYFARE
tara:strand:+ start:670 stop:840 length:171 start_codon:yes stop_codon:yes gene_type:complete